MTNECARIGFFPYLSFGCVYIGKSIEWGAFIVSLFFVVLSASSNVFDKLFHPCFAPNNKVACLLPLVG